MMTMIQTNVNYSVENINDDTFTDAYQLWDYDWGCTHYDLNDDWDLESAAEKCADDFLHNHDGWEFRSWTQQNEPLRFYIWKDENTKVAFDIECEYEPRFNACKVE